MDAIARNTNLFNQFDNQVLDSSNESLSGDSEELEFWEEETGGRRGFEAIRTYDENRNTVGMITERGEWVFFDLNRNRYTFCDRFGAILQGVADRIRGLRLFA